MEIAALEEALPDVLHTPLHFGLVLGVSGTGRVSDETPVLRVFQEALGEARMQRVSIHNCGREIIDHQVLVCCICPVNRPICGVGEKGASTGTG